MKKINRFMLWSSLTLSYCSSLMSSTYFVNSITGNNTNNGTSLITPFKTITKALSVAVNSDVINVAAGTYNTSIGEDFPLIMVSGVTLNGSAGAVKTIIDATGDSNRVINCINNTATTIIQGFMIKGGYALDYSSGGATAKGGGILIDGGSPVIQNNIITGNTVRGYDFYQAGLGANNGGTCYGGGIYLIGSPKIQNNIISYNFAIGGGGKDFRGGWSGNGSDGGRAKGGGIFDGGNGTIINNTIYGNIAIGGLGGSSNSLNAGWGGDAEGGGVNSTSGNSIIRNNIFSDNSVVAGSTGGGANGQDGLATNGALYSFTGTNFSYNLYYNNSATRNSVTINSNGINLGTNNIMEKDPLFISAIDFHFSSTISPAYHAGTSAGAPAMDFDGTIRSLTTPSIGAFEGMVPLSAKDNIETIPSKFTLLQNYPNPFNPSTQFEFTVPSSGHATLTIYNIIGQRVAILFDGIAEAGHFYQSSFNAEGMAGGMYFARLTAGRDSQLRKLLLAK